MVGRAEVEVNVSSMRSRHCRSPSRKVDIAGELFAGLFLGFPWRIQSAGTSTDFVSEKKVLWQGLTAPRPDAASRCLAAVNPITPPEI
jgi:hypothetical protein